MTRTIRKLEVLTAAGTGLYAACALGYFNRIPFERQAGPWVMDALFGGYVALGALRLVGKRPEPAALSSWPRAAVVFFAMLLPLAATSEGRVLWEGGWWLASGGAVLGILAALALGTSFDVVPAVREIVSRGPYRVIRHPGVTALFLMTAGFLLVHWNSRNATILGMTMLLGIVTAFLEEGLLRREDLYVQYTAQVRWRFVPGVA